MGRPARFDADQLLDAALALGAAKGPAAVSMSAVAARVGAPSGSLYHRFPSRPALLGSLWLRTAGRFQAGFLAALAGEDPGAAGLAAAAHTVAWSREHEDEARLLLHGAHELELKTWPEPLRRRHRREQAKVAAAIEALAERLGAGSEEERERVVLATVELPLALVRRRLRAGEPIPAAAERTIEPGVRALLGLPASAADPATALDGPGGPG